MQTTYMTIDGDKFAVGIQPRNAARYVQAYVGVLFKNGAWYAAKEFSPAQARELAAILTQAADEIDQPTVAAAA